jgi:hypothetical protein
MGSHVEQVVFHDGGASLAGAERRGEGSAASQGGIGRRALPKRAAGVGNRNRSSGSALRADEDVGRDAQLLAKPDDHGDGQGPSAVEHFRDAPTASDEAMRSFRVRPICSIRKRMAWYRAEFWV